MNAKWVELLMATFFGSILAFASLAVIHEYGPGECSREAMARTELGAELREARASNDVAHSVFDAAEAVTPDGRIATLAVTADGRPVDEMQFVDADIAAAFSGCVYLTGTPTQVQLARELHLAREMWSSIYAAFVTRGVDLRQQVQCPSCAMWSFAGDIRPCSGCGGESPWVLAMRAIVAPRVSQATDDAREER